MVHQVVSPVIHSLHCCGLLSLSLSLSGRLKAEKVVGIVSTHARNFLKIILIVSFLSDISFYIFSQQSCILTIITPSSESLHFPKLNHQEK